MNITVVTSDYPYAGHQTFIFVEQLVKSMVDLGHNVNVVTTQNILKIITGKQKYIPIKAQAFTNKGKSYSVFRPFYLSFGGRVNCVKPLLTKIRSKAIVNVLEKIDADVIYCHFWENVLLIKEYAIKHKLPIFVACGEGDNALEDMVSSLGEDGVRSLRVIMSGVISVSSENRRKCVEFGLIDKSKIVVEPNCVDTTIFHKQNVSELRKELGIENDDFTVVFVGGFIPRKGPDRLAKAITQLNDPHIKSIFIGKEFPGYKYPFNCEGIVYKGTADHEAIPKLLNCADIFVLPTQKEGCCNSIVEALACGLPVISSNGSFNDDILDDTNSIRIDVDNVDEIAKSIGTLRDDKEKRTMMTNSSLDRLEKYSIEGRAKRITSFIKRMIQKQV